MYVYRVENLVSSENAGSLFGQTEYKYAPSCSLNNDNETNITLNDIEIPYSEKHFNYDLTSSFVKVKAIHNQTGSCDYKYYIYLTDGNYSIGTPNNPILSDNLTNKSVTKN